MDNVLRSLTAWRWPTVGGTPADVIPALEVVRLAVLVAVLVTVPLAEPDLGSGARGTVIAVALGVSTLGYVVWMLTRGRPGPTAAAIAVMGLAGGVLAGVSPLSTAIAVGCVATSSAGVRLDIEKSLVITAGTVAAFLATALATGAPAGTLLGYPLTFVGLWAFGLTRHAYLLRAEQAERMLAETRRAQEAQAEAAALGERTRIAREIHDVLAHSLAAVSVNLQAAEGLLSALPDRSSELSKAIECVSRAGVLTREGMADARRAILALRDNAAPLSDQLSVLARQFTADGGVPVDFVVTGAPRPVGADVGLAAYRTAQEALTNARKHAPGQPVTLGLEYSLGEITVRVVNPMPLPSADGPLAATGAGHGLAGLRERAALSGGTLAAGEVGRQWRVLMTMPA